MGTLAFGTHLFLNIILGIFGLAKKPVEKKSPPPGSYPPRTHHAFTTYGDMT
jgi:hypothetical protein